MKNLIALPFLLVSGCVMVPGEKYDYTGAVLFGLGFVGVIIIALLAALSERREKKRASQDKSLIGTRFENEDWSDRG